jgi:hypothetical protein
MNIKYTKAFEKLSYDELMQVNKYYGKLIDSYESIHSSLNFLLQCHESKKEFMNDLDSYIKQGYIYKINGKKINRKIFERSPIHRFSYRMRMDDLIGRPYISNYKSLSRLTLRENVNKLYLFKSKKEAETMKSVYVNLKGVK